MEVINVVVVCDYWEQPYLLGLAHNQIVETLPLRLWRDTAGSDCCNRMSNRWSEIKLIVVHIDISLYFDAGLPCEDRHPVILGRMQVDNGSHRWLPQVGSSLLADYRCRLRPRLFHFCYLQKPPLYLLIGRAMMWFHEIVFPLHRPLPVVIVWGGDVGYYSSLGQLLFQTTNYFVPFHGEVRFDRFYQLFTLLLIMEGTTHEHWGLGATFHKCACCSNSGSYYNALVACEAIVVIIISLFF